MRNDHIFSHYFQRFFIFPLLLLLGASAFGVLKAQTSTEFWLAPPEVTQGHGTSIPIFVRLATTAAPAVITIEMPANVAGFNGGVPIVVNLAANSSQTVNLNAFVNILETRPTGMVLNTGLKISADVPITAIYEVSPTNNPDIWALKGLNGLGTEFYVPMQNIWNNGIYTPRAYSSFDIVATEDNTTVLIYPTTALDGGQPAFQSFTITLNKGQTYSGSKGANEAFAAALNPTGTAILSDKPIAVSVKDDSVNPTGAGCRDLMGDQLVPVDIVGTEYIVNRGGLTVVDGDNAYVVATRNNTIISVGGVVVATLFAGQTYRINIPNSLTYITGTKPFYCIHVTGFGCEVGMALLPPLNCAGSEQVSFVRSTSESFFLNVLVPAGAEDAFILNGSNTLVPASAFAAVPGTGGVWLGARIAFLTTEIPQGQANLLTNSEEPFSLGLINGGSSSGCRYGYFSEFSAEIIVDAGPNQIVCANTITQLDASISGGATQGIWSSNGTGSFNPNANTIDAIYEPSPADLSASGVTLTLTSISNCFPVEDQVVITYTPAPIVNAGADILACSNNTTVNLNGFVDIASGGLWSGGAGTFTPGPGNLNATYIPTAAEVTSGTLLLTLTSTGNGICNLEFDEVLITFGPPPTANAGPDQTLCANNLVTQLNGSVTVATGGQWSGGGGSFNPLSIALSPTYTPSNTELINGSVTLTFTSTGNGGCTAVNDQIIITYTPSPIVNAGSDQTLCKNNNVATLGGSVTNATGGIWSGGAGTFSPNNTTLNATYTPTVSENLTGIVTLTLTSTGNGNCNPVADILVVNYTDPPIVNAGPDGLVCSNNSAIALSGTLIGPSFGIWSGGAGSFLPNTTSLNATYIPTAAEITSGSVTLSFTSLDNGNCNPVADLVTYAFTPSPTANAGLNRFACANNPALSLNGSVAIAGGGVWSGGGGSFSPDNTTLSAIYTPTAAEVANGSVTLTLTTTANGTCNSVADQVLITYTIGPTTNAGPNQIRCANNANITLAGSVTVATGGTWTGGLGTFTPNPNTLNAVYTPTASEIASGTLTLTLTTTGNSTCTAVTDQVAITFTPAPTVEAGANISVCSNNAQVSLNGSFTIAGGATWSGGAGTFLPNANTLNALYNPTVAELASGSLILTLTTTGNGTCNAVQDFVNIAFTPSPTANAGLDQTVCANNSLVNLNGSVTLASGGTWSGGSGTFNPNNTSLGASYTPSAAEITAGTVTLTLTTTGNGTCNAVTDQMVITITPAPTANAGADQTVCANNANITLNGSVTTATGGTWSGGSGTFTPNASTLNATYSPSAGEINAGTLTLTLTTTGNGTCAAVTDMVTFTFSPAPTANAGVDQTLCANNAQTSLTGAVTIATGGTWSGGAGTFAPNANSLNATYTPTAAELTAGTATLTLTTTGNGTCLPVADNIVLTFTPAPTANAGVDRTVCANNADVNLSGSVSIATGGIWSGGSGTFTPGNTILNPTYTPSAAEITAGTVTLTLTTTGNGTCNAVTDQMVITITPTPVVNAGSDQQICSNNTAVQLAGTVANAIGGAWTGGFGSFNPNSATLNAVYTPLPAEVASGSILLTLTSTGNNGCTAVTDQFVINFTPSPTSTAGPDQTLCASSPVATLAGATTISTGREWTGGNGTFNPNPFVAAPTYSPTAAEIVAGSVTLTLTTTGNGNCNPVTDNVVVTYTPTPSIEAGPNVTVCANNPVAILNASFNNSGGAIWSGGQGFFNPANTDPQAAYTPSNAEIINGSVTLTFTSTGTGACPAAIDQMTVIINPAPVVNAGIDLNRCANNNLAQLAGSVQFAAGGAWSGGAGAFSPSASALNATYQPSLGELSAGFVTLTLTSTGNGTCNLVTDQVTITYTPAPIVDAGVNQTRCANNAQVQLNGSFTVAEGANWSGGAGNFNPGASSPNAIYTPSASEIANGSLTLTLTTFGNGTCLPVSDQVLINFTPAPAVEAGPDYFACVDALVVPLSGMVSGGSNTGVWSTSGSGIFVPTAGALNGSYQISSADSLIGQVVLTLTSTNNGLCTAVIDNFTVFISPAGTANVGADISRCKNNPNAALTGIIGGAATSGSWSTSGTGIFTPNNTSLNPSYLPSDADLVANSVVITFAVNSCNQASDNLTITYTPSPVVNAGTDITVCSSETQVMLNGIVSGASTTGTWTTSGNGAFSPNADALNTSYAFSAADIAGQVVTLTLTSSNIGNCVAVTDQLTLNIFPQGTANAGLDVTACKNNPEIQLNGTITGANQALWTSSGTGTFAPNNTSLVVTYVPSAQDLLGNSVQLILSAVNSCNAASDFMNVAFVPAPVVNAGPDQAACGDVIPFQITGTVANAGGAVWTTAGTGTFQNANNLNTFYVASQNDIDAGGINLLLTSTGNVNCFAVVDTLFIAISTGIVVNAGTDRSACAQASGILINGTVANGSTTGIWTTSGNGGFTPSASSLNATYNFTPADISGGSVIITLSSTNNGICAQQSDSFELTFGNTAFVDAGQNIFVCESEDLIQLNGLVSGETTTGTWTTSGSGTFLPTPNSLNAFYDPSAADISAGNVILTLMSTGSTLCLEGQSSLSINFQSLPLANAGMDQLICGSTSSVQLLGSVGSASGGVWSTAGSGTFSPSPDVLTALYLPSPADSIAGSVLLTLTTSGNANCAVGIDQMIISFGGAISVNAGPDQEVCESAILVNVLGTVEGSTDFQWSSNGSGSFNPSDAVLSTTYLPAVADVAQGFVTLYLTGQGGGNCPARIDSLLVTFDLLPIITVTSSVDVCTSSQQVAITSDVQNANSILWSSPGGGSFTPNATSEDVNYIFTAIEIANGTANLQLGATSNGACGTVQQFVNIQFLIPATVDAGPDLVACDIDGQVTLAGAISGITTSGLWSTNSFGTFNPTPNQLDGSYLFGPNDILLGTASLTLTSIANGPCPAVIDNLVITINKQPIVNAGADFAACGNAGSFDLTGVVSNSASILWTTAGDGVFLPDATVTDPTYVLGPGDESAGTITLNLEAAGLLGCNTVTDELVITLSNPIEAFFVNNAACAGLGTQFLDQTSVSTGSIVSWNWDFGNGIVSNLQNPTVIFDVEGGYNVRLVASSSLGCNDTIVQLIIVSPTPLASFTLSNNPAPTEFDIQFTSTSQFVNSWLWNFGDNEGTADTEVATYSYLESGSYVITLTATNQGGCSNRVSQVLVIDGIIILPPRLPNTFSPNGDGLNDIYFIRGGPFTEITFKVYDGWGSEIFSTNDQSIGWDGTQNGKQSPVGVYVFTIVATNLNNDQFDYSGRINLLR